MRVGYLAKNLLLATDSEVELVVLCSQIPTFSLLNQITELFHKFSEVSVQKKADCALLNL